MSTKISFADRAELSGENPLKNYLLQLIATKKTNLCVSADVNSTTSLLRLAEEVGDYICVLKTHADIIDDFGPRTVKGLREISKRKKFLIFEDRKFGDIGSTVQQQYTRGPLAIASWAHIVNAHVFPGPDIVTALQSGAVAALNNLRHAVETEIFVGTPTLSEDGIDEDSDTEAGERSNKLKISEHRSRNVVTTTTIYQTYEQSGRKGGPTQSPASPSLDPEVEEAIHALPDPPLARGLLLFAQMSSRGNLMDADYTAACVETAKQHKVFVMGFISQQSLNRSSSDNFLSMTPGVKMVSEKESKGDGLGQQYRTPEIVVKKDGCDIIIVGRGIIQADNRRKEAERYRREAWKAYEARLSS